MDDAIVDNRFAGSLPEMYQRFMVPLIFEPYAADLCRRVQAVAPCRVLELAAGTGVLTRHLARSLPASTEIVATDLNPPMLAEAARVGTERPVQWQPADAMQLPFGDGSFDAVACQFGVMFLPDKVAGLRESHRVLQAGGTLAFNAWDRIETSDFIAVISEALDKMFPQRPPRFMHRGPHGYHDPGRIEADLRAAGFSSVVVEAVDARSRAARARDVVMGYLRGTPMSAEIDGLGPDARAPAEEAATRALEQAFGTGPIEGRIRALVAVARR